MSVYSEAIRPRMQENNEFHWYEVSIFVSVKVTEIFTLHKGNLKAAYLPRYSEEITVSNKHVQPFYFSLNLCRIRRNVCVSLGFKNDPREK